MTWLSGLAIVLAFVALEVAVSLRRRQGAHRLEVASHALGAEYAETRVQLGDLTELLNMPEPDRLSEGVAHWPDVELVASLARQDEVADRALGTLFDRHHQAAYGYAMRIVGNEADAEEVVQETFVSVWRHAAQYPAGATVADWILKIVSDTGQGMLRARRELSHGGPDTSGPNPNPTIDIHRSERIPIAQVMFEQIPASHRKALELALIMGLSTEEVSRVLDVPEDVVLVRIRLALWAFGESLQTLRLAPTT